MQDCNVATRYILPFGLHDVASHGTGVGRACRDKKAQRADICVAQGFSPGTKHAIGN